MIINKEGKLFGKISIVDIAVVLIVILLAIGIYTRFSGNTKVVVSNGQKIECTFVVKNLRQYSVDALKKGGTMYDKTSKELIGTITDVRVESGRYNVNMMDGSYKEAIPEDRYNVYVTVEFNGKAGDSGYYTAANKFLGAGSWVTVVTKYSECGAMVTSIGLAQ